LAYAKFSLGEFADAEPLYRNVLARRSQLFGGSDVRTLTAMSNLSACLISQRSFREAEHFLRKASGILQESNLRKEGPNRECAQAIAQNMTAILMSTDRHEEACKWAQRAIDFGGDFPVNWARLGESQYRQGNFTAAIDALERAVDDGQRVAVVWNVDMETLQAEVVELGTLPRTDRSFASGVNATQAVGGCSTDKQGGKGSVSIERTPFLADNGTLTDLNDLAVDLGGLRNLQFASDISDLGDVCGGGTTRTGSRAFVAIPVP
jgi:tetratricopeptide (TPR) repeat protein